MINKNKIISWSLYDFASQPFSTIVVTFVFSSFFTKHIAYDDKIGTQMWSNAIAISAVIVAIVSPFIGAIADNTGRKKLFLVLFTMISSLFASMLFIPEKGEVYFELILFIIDNFSFYCKANQITLVFVTHDESLANMADHQIKLSKC